MYIVQGRFCYLEELTTENDKELFELMKNNKEENKEMLKILEKERIKKYIVRTEESQSSVNPERTIINFEINLKSLKEINEKLNEFYKRK